MDIDVAMLGNDKYEQKIKFLEDSIIKHYSSMGFPGANLLGQTFEEYIFQEKYIDLLEKSIDRNLDFVLNEFKESLPGLYGEHNIEQLAHEDIKKARDKVYNVVRDLELANIKVKKVEEKNKSQPTEAAVLLGHNSIIAKYRELKTKLIETDNIFSNELVELEKKRKSGSLVDNGNEALCHYMGFMQKVLNNVNDRLRGYK
jgi:hypothetical protein